MSTTISVVCYKSKVLKNNESPLMLRICKDGKRKYESIGISILPSLWDFKQNKPTRKCPNKEYIERLIAEKVKVYTDKVIEFKSQEKEFTATSLMEKVNKPVKRKTVHGYNLVKALWTVLKRSGVNTFLICEALGRSSERVTQAVKMTIDKMFSDI